MEKAFHVQRLTAKIATAEKSIDAAMAAAADLFIEMQSAQSGLEVSPVMSDPAFAKITEAMTLLAQARTSVVTGHKRLAKLGNRVVGVGTYECPPSIEEGDEDVGTAQLRRVG